MKKGFTLIELLSVVAIIAILAIAVVLTINPAELLRQGRDATRVSDMGTLNKAVSLYYQDAMNSPSTMFMGTSSIIYVSVPDPAATSTAGDQCQGLGLPVTPTGYTYHCATSSSYMNVNGTGWLPINFNSYSAGLVISKLPVDPVNTTSTNLYYTYETDGVGGFKVAAFFESQKYASQMASDGGNDTELYEKGTNLTLASSRGLVGYWPFEEGVSSTTYDGSGNNATGSWNGTATGTNGYFSPGKVGAWAGAFDGSTDYVGISTAPSVSGPITMMAWFYSPTASGVYQGVITTAQYSIYLDIGGTSGVYLGANGKIGVFAISPAWTINTWNHIAVTEDGTYIKIYINGVLANSTANTSVPSGNPGALYLGRDTLSRYYLKGFIDDVRVYNRALSATEIQEMYNAEK